MFNLRIIGVVCVALLLAACGGGGGGGGGGSGSASKQVASTTTTYFALAPQMIVKRLISYYTDGSQSTTDVTGFSQGGLAIDPNDHVTVTGNFDLILNGKETLVGAIVEPSISTAPILTKENYPSDWTTTGAVTKPNVSQANGKYFDGVAYVADGSATAPFRQGTLTPYGPSDKATAINDPNAFVKAPKTGVYDLRWGTPDPKGPLYASYFKDNNSYTLPASKKVFDAVLSGSGYQCQSVAANQNNCGAMLPAPSPEVIDAWNKGWTGKGQNILIWDDINNSPISAHPATVETIAERYAWGSNFFGMTYKVTSPNVLNLDGSISNSTSKISINVINMSYGADLDDYFSKNPNYVPFSETGLIAARNAYQFNYTSRAIFLTNTNYQGPQNGTGGFDFSGAVLVKAAGNDSIDAQYEPLTYWLTRNSNDLSRLLIVGALTDIGLPTARVSLASYSNTAGSDPTVQSRFLVESGRSVFSSSLNNFYNGQPLTSGEGTSYAAPRVAGYVAIVRQKFENLTAANTADIMLATARYDTLSCYNTPSGCDKAIYGQGEASLSRALAPVGYLR